MQGTWFRGRIGRIGLALGLAGLLLPNLIAQQAGATVPGADYAVPAFDIVSDTPPETRPRISGETVVYQEGGTGENADGDIRRVAFSEDNDDGEKVNEGDANSKRPDIDGDVIVWTEAIVGPTGLDIRGYDISDDNYFTVADNVSDQDFPAVSGNVVVFQSDEGGTWDIIGYRINDDEHFDIATTGDDELEPAIDGDLVAWTRDDGSDTDIFARDLGSSETFRVTDVGDASQPAVDGDRIVYKQGDGDGAGIYIFDRSEDSRRQLATDTEGDRNNPRIDGDFVVWSDNRDGDPDIYGYDLANDQEFLIDDQGDDQTVPDISVGSTNVVWQDSSNNGDIRGGMVEVTGVEEPDDLPTVDPGLPAPRDDRFYFQTGFRIDNDVINDFFLSRGGVNTFGFPISRTFLFRGVVVQFFQRHIIEIGPNGNARLPNLLDPGLMPVDQINFSAYPPVDNALKAQTPPATDLPALLAFIQQRAPEEFSGRPTRFFTTFNNFVTCESAFRNAPCQPNLLPGFNLEVVGAVTSNPAPDPANGNFIYQRFQRTILHYDLGCNCTQALLLASYFKDVLTGDAQESAPDLLERMAEIAPQFVDQYNNGAPLGLNRPDELPDTNMQNAFEQQ